MALPLEVNPRSSITQEDLLNKSVLESLISEQRVPMVIFRIEESELRVGKCFIPGNENEPAQVLEVSIEEAKKIGKLRNEIQKLKSSLDQTQ